MDKLEKAIAAVKYGIRAAECAGNGKNLGRSSFVMMHTDDLDDILDVLKAQEQEISRLKHHVDCGAAEKLPSGCVGYGRGFNDDEPCETCKACEKYNGYGEE